MDMFWSIIFLATFMTGIMGWLGAPLFMNLVLWTCNWLEGTPMDWGREAAFSIFVPFFWLFSIIEIIMIYFS